MKWLLLLFLPGCVTMSAHEKGMREAYNRGQINMGYRCLHLMEGMDEKDTEFVLRGLLVVLENK